MYILLHKAKIPTLGKHDKILNLRGSEPTNCFDFAKEIKSYMKLYHPDMKLAHISPVISVNYPAEAKRPMFSVLDITKARRLGLYENAFVETFNSQIVSYVTKVE